VQNQVKLLEAAQQAQNDKFSSLENAKHKLEDENRRYREETDRCGRECEQLRRTVDEQKRYTADE